MEHKLHVGKCGLSDQITIQGDETIYDVLHVVKNIQERTFEVHTLCGKVFTLKGLDANVVHVGHSMELWNSGATCPTCEKVCEA